MRIDQEFLLKVTLFELFETLLPHITHFPCYVTLAGTYEMLSDSFNLPLLAFLQTFKMSFRLDVSYDPVSH